ncbi:MAG: N-acetylmuramoyl-L-alanine amidase [Candidatus Wallbacteria bacterium]|nr:N-acetylmuramoyl-L-alanine amidase [Candidatus Wallbacteria bacterium]
MTVFKGHWPERGESSTLLIFLLIATARSWGAELEFPCLEPGRVQECVGIEGRPGRGLELGRTTAGRWAQGYLTWKPERTVRPVTAVRLQAEAANGTGGRVEWLLRSFGAADGSACGWLSLAPGARLALPVPASMLQLRVRLFGGPTGVSPNVTRVTVICYDAPVTARESQDSETGCPEEGLEAGYQEPPDLPGPLAAVEPPPIVRRADWGGRAARETYEPSRPGKLTVHHSSQPRASRCKGAATIRGIQQFHMASRGWKDIAYHYLIAPDGTVYQGRPEGASGSHSRPNRHKLGVCVLGNFNRGEESVTPLARASLVRLLAYLAGKHGISARAIYGHRDFNRTDCPGGALYGDLDRLRDEVGAMIAGALLPVAAGGQRAQAAGPSGKTL